MKIAVVGGGPAGLYFSILMKKTNSEHDINVYEQNQYDDTFGFGVVFSDETLDNFLSHDPKTYEKIIKEFAYWDEIDFNFKGQTIRTEGHGFCGCGRRELLLILQERCHELGVNFHFRTEIKDLERFQDADLIVGADGINSTVRNIHENHFSPNFEWRRNKFIWLGSTKPHEAFTFDFTENEAGIWVLGAYQFNDNHATWIIEAPEPTWDNVRSEVEDLDEKNLIKYMEVLWKEKLDGHSLIPNKSVWRSFPTIRCDRWSFNNIVLIGDALHTAHYSIGSGTKLAMEDAIELHNSFSETNNIEEALKIFEEMRRTEVEITQHAADVSVVWTENAQRYWNMEPIQAAYSMLTRSKQITHENLRVRDNKFIDRIEDWFSSRVRNKEFNIPPRTPPMFTPFRLRDMTLANRTVVSPMDMYSAVDGTVGDFHFVHLGSLAMGGAGLVFSEMTCVSEDGRITPGCAGLYKREHSEAWARVINYIHNNSNAKFCMQIGHSGRKGSTRVAWEGMDLPLNKNNWQLIAPSAIPYSPRNNMPREMTESDMADVESDFVLAAKLARNAEVDMIEIHMAHGYLLSSFITPVSNQRKDKYGGSLDNRMRFPLRIFDAVRNVWPDERPISVRISATDWVGDEGIIGNDAVEIAKALKEHGCDIINVSAGQTTPEAKPVYGRMFQVWLSEQVRLDADIPTIAAGNITTWDQVNTILAAGRADLIAIGRPHLTNPHFTLQAAAYYGFDQQRWPLPYETGKEQSYRLALRDREEQLSLRLALKPDSHNPPK